ncbi:MAG: sensor histidine kinase [Acidimicrobiia bacterium]
MHAAIEDASGPGDAGLRVPLGAESVELSYSVLDAAPLGMALADAAGHVHWANASLCGLLGVSLQELLAETAAHPAFSGPAVGLGHEVLLERADGSTRWVWLSTSRAVDGSGAPLKAGEPPVPLRIHQVLDVDARHRAEVRAAEASALLEQRNAELERSNQELAEFAYVVSHDLSEPLRVIAGHVQLLADRYRGQLSDEADEWIEFTVDGAARMRALIDSLLQYSRAGRGEATVADVRVADVVGGALAGLDAAVADAHAVVTVGELPTVRTDASDLGRILSNLIANAIKFRRPGVAPLVGVTGRRLEEGWEITVADNGIGIPEQHRERATRLFQRLNPRGTYEGTGLGLAICRKLVARHGGDLHIGESDLGGTAVSFTIPDRGVDDGC